MSDGMSNSDRMDRVCTDVAVMAAQMGEMSKRLDEQSKSIATLNHNSTNIQISIAQLESTTEQNGALIKELKSDLMSSFKTYLTLFGFAITIITFIINYFRV